MPLFPDFLRDRTREVLIEVSADEVSELAIDLAREAQRQLDENSNNDKPYDNIFLSKS